MVPGSNLLQQALRVIKPIDIIYERYAGRTETRGGSFVSSYFPPVTISASVQAVDRSRYENLGLVFGRKYVMIFSSTDMQSIVRDESPDRYTLPDGRTYTAVSDTDWFGLDGAWVTGAAGWTYVLAVMDQKKTTELP